jgi:hypothetical protein
MTSKGARELWMTPDQWPSSQSGDYMFLLDAFKRLGRDRHPDWDNLPGYFAQRDPRGIGLPGPQEIATDEDRWMAHQALYRTTPAYVPNFRGELVWDGDLDGFEEVGEPKFHFSDADWKIAANILDNGVTLDQAEMKIFENVVSEIANAAANAQLRTYTRPVDIGDYTLMSEGRWDIELPRLITRFAFGRLDLHSDGSTNLIFVSSEDMENLLNPKSHQKASPAKNDVHQICIKWLIRLRLAGPQQAIKLRYYEAFQKNYPSLSDSQFIACWNESAKLAKREFENRLSRWTPQDGSPKPVEHVWGKNGPRKSESVIEFQHI